jgi:hypothetical protein
MPCLFFNARVEALTRSVPAAPEKFKHQFPLARIACDMYGRDSEPNIGARRISIFLFNSDL